MNAGAIIAICVLLLVLIACGVGGALWWSNHSAQAVAVKEETVAGKATVGGQQAQSNAAAQQIVVSGEARDHVILDVQQHNDAAIQAAQGSNDRVPPAEANAIVGSLCAYPAYASDPQCVVAR